MNQPAVTLYSKDKCVQCTAAKRFMNKKGIEYTIVDVTQDAGAFDYVKSLGYTSVPVTVVDTSTQPIHWFGANPTLLDMHFPKAA